MNHTVQALLLLALIMIVMVIVVIFIATRLNAYIKMQMEAKKSRTDDIPKRIEAIAENDSCGDCVVIEQKCDAKVADAAEPEVINPFEKVESNVLIKDLSRPDSIPIPQTKEIEPEKKIINVSVQDIRPVYVEIARFLPEKNKQKTGLGDYEITVTEDAADLNFDERNISRDSDYTANTDRARNKNHGSTEAVGNSKYIEKSIETGRDDDIAPNRGKGLSKSDEEGLKEIFGDFDKTANEQKAYGSGFGLGELGEKFGSLRIPETDAMQNTANGKQEVDWIKQDERIEEVQETPVSPLNLAREIAEMNAANLAEEEARAQATPNKYNLGKSGKRYTEAELESIIKD